MVAEGSRKWLFVSGLSEGVSVDYLGKEPNSIVPMCMYNVSEGGYDYGYQNAS